MIGLVVFAVSGLVSDSYTYLNDGPSISLVLLFAGSLLVLAFAVSGARNPDRFGLSGEPPLSYLIVIGAALYATGTVLRLVG